MTFHNIVQMLASITIVLCLIATTMMLVRIKRNISNLQAALTMIGTDCIVFVGEDTCCTDVMRSPYAKCSDYRWCDQCIARTALQGVEFK